MYNLSKRKKKKCVPLVQNYVTRLYLNTDVCRQASVCCYIYI
jgi:hypothetical protein